MTGGTGELGRDGHRLALCSSCYLLTTSSPGRDPQSPNRHHSQRSLSCLVDILSSLRTALVRRLVRTWYYSPGPCGRARAYIPDVGFSFARAQMCILHTGTAVSYYNTHLLPLAEQLKDKMLSGTRASRHLARRWASPQLVASRQKRSDEQRAQEETSDTSGVS